MNTITSPRVKNVDEWLEGLTLSKDGHEPGPLMCASEALAYIAGEPLSASPMCVSPLISAYLRHTNDLMNDAERDQLLKPLILSALGTSGGDEGSILLLAINRSIHKVAPDALSLLGFHREAGLLARMNHVNDPMLANKVRREIMDLQGEHGEIQCSNGKSKALYDVAQATLGSLALMIASAETDILQHALGNTLEGEVTASRAAKVSSFVINNDHVDVDGCWDNSLQLFKDMVSCAKGDAIG